MVAKRRKRRVKKKLTPEQKEQKAHIQEIRSIFTRTGFVRIPTVSDKEFTFEGVTGDLDDIFLFGNILVLGEYTVSKSSNVSDHLKKKKILFDKICQAPAKFVKFLKTTFPAFVEKSGEDIHEQQFEIRILYCSKNKIDKRHKNLVPNVVYLDYPILKYFVTVVSAVKKSARNELLSFLSFKNSDVIEQENSAPVAGSQKYPGSVLPEAHSNFDDGFKVVSFYVDPAALLQRSYVLRRDGWRDGDELYQRMILKGKVESIRNHLRTNRRVFLNNIIVTLPEATKILDKEGNTKNLSNLTKTEPADILLPTEFNSVGIIDGQHRVFAYHEGGAHDTEIKILRKRQNLLVTGVIYPDGVSALDRTKFEAKLFLEINSNQTNAKSDLKQAIGLLLTPYAPSSIGKQVINTLNESGPLFDQFERHFFDTHKIKTTSIVSYGLVPILKLHGEDSLFKLWKHPNKEKLILENNKTLLREYVEFCSEELNKFLLAAKLSCDSRLWTPDRRVKGRLLTTTIINGFVICLRLAVENNQIGNTEFYKSKLAGLSEFPFNEYHSSQYSRMGNDMYERFF